MTGELEAAVHVGLDAGLEGGTLPAVLCERILAVAAERLTPVGSQWTRITGEDQGWVAEVDWLDGNIVHARYRTTPPSGSGGMKFCVSSFLRKMVPAS